MARSAAPRRRNQAVRLPGWQALSRLHAGRAGVRTRRTVVESRQLRLFQRLHGAPVSVELRAAAASALGRPGLLSRSRRAVIRAMAAGASSGTAKHELALISHRT